ncbi:MAG TPA: ABC transporter permease [Candidatus Tectomicrobia bacterium]|jgi:ABC-type dipeptide/oligopeptide/nickel transport system permease subunit
MAGSRVQTAKAVPPGLAVQPVSLWQHAWRRLLRNKLAVAGGSAVGILALVAIFANVLAPYHYTTVNFSRNYEFPSREFPLGTDHLGRDVLSRIMYGARVSMTVGLVAEFIVLCIGVPLGSLAGYYGGKVDMVLMRCVDVMYAFPRLLFVILIMSMLGRGLLNIFIAIGLTGWVRVARLTRAQILSLKEREFCEAARAAGASHLGIIVRHLLPNALTPIIVSLTFGIPEAIFTEAALSFIGVGISPPTPSWGQMVGENQQFIRSYWYLCVFPSMGIATLMLAFTFLGDGLRDALDPRLNE